MCVYVRTHMCVHIYVCEHHGLVCICTFVCALQCVCVHWRMHEFLCVRVHACVRMCIACLCMCVVFQSKMDKIKVSLPEGKVLPETQTTSTIEPSNDFLGGGHLISQAPPSPALSCRCHCSLLNRGPSLLISTGHGSDWI